MLITPIVFLAVVTGIGGADSLGRVGRVGLKSLAYFQAGPLLALLLGLLAVNVFRPGAGVQPPSAACAWRATPRATRSRVRTGAGDTSSPIWCPAARSARPPPRASC
ncbi:cation:dicarboxylate symporter family transporter [Streptomyces rimosus]|uniref:cation:dicarboxylate symporter family transporter n=1 Tax=Streptomyces rimosus TaxID=1927 RepID=UPI001F40439D|nr:cation:dicarboxylase symporter family transporter [Streptomyces rimosus]